MGSMANLASTATKATTKMGAMAVETTTEGFDHCSGVDGQYSSLLVI
jgi:hypothetical protein